MAGEELGRFEARAKLSFEDRTLPNAGTRLAPDGLHTMKCNP
jgi:hypothetical protein